MREHPNNLISSTFFYLISRIIPAGLAFLAIGVFTRLLSPEEYGVYALSLSLISLLSTGTNNWIYLSVVRLLPGEAEPDRFQASVLVIYLSITALLLLGGVAYVLLFSESATERVIIGLSGLFLIVQGWMEINLHMLIARSQARLYTKLVIIRAIFSTCMGIALAVLGWGPAGILLGSTLGMLIPSLWLTRHHWDNIHLRHSRMQDIDRIRRFGLPLSLSSMLDNVIFYSDRVLLGWLVGTGAVGVYAVGYDIADKALKSVMYSVGAATLPTAVRTLEQKGEAAARLQLEQNVIILVAMGLPTAAGLCLIAPNLAGLVGREFHDEAVTLIPLIAIGTFLACLRSNYLDHAFHLGKRALPLTLVTAITAVMNVALNLLLIPYFGMVGAAYATVISFIIAVGAGFTLGRRVFRLPMPWLEFLKIAVAVAVMATAVLLLPELGGTIAALALKISVGGVVYLTMAGLLKIGGIRDILPALRSRLAPSPQP